MNVKEEAIEQIEKVTPVMAKHFWLLYIGTLLLSAIVTYHNILVILPHPVTANGITTELHETYQARFYSRRGGFTERLYARKIKFTWQNKDYEVTGGWDEEMASAVPVKVVFNANHPEQALELSVLGLLDFRVLRWTVPFWIFFSGFLYAFASADSHFTAFNLKVPKLTTRSFALILAAILFIPLYSSADLLLFGKRADGVMGDDADNVNGSYLRPIVFKAAGVQYAAYSQYANDYEKLSGKHFPILYRPDDPNRCCLYQLGSLYSNNYTILMGISLIFVTGWLYSSRIFVSDK